MKISKNLSLAELIRSSTAKRKGINNNPSSDCIENFKLLAEKIFEPIREHFGVPIYISSGYRSPQLNAAKRGSKTSQHIQCEAIDIDMDGSNDGVSNADVFFFIRDNLEFDQLIWEFGNDKNPDWVHVSYESITKQRKQVLLAKKKGNRTIYVQYK
jgi:hypothetical protein